MLVALAGLQHLPVGVLQRELRRNQINLVPTSALNTLLDEFRIGRQTRANIGIHGHIQARNQTKGGGKRGLRIQIHHKDTEPLPRRIMAKMQGMAGFADAALEVAKDDADARCRMAGIPLQQAANLVGFVVIVDPAIQ